MATSDPEYYAKRAAKAREMAYSAKDPSARKSHLMMAEWYARRASAPRPVVVEQG